MKLNSLRTFAIATALTAVSAFGATPAIGVASAFGSFTVNSAQVSGNANVFNGSQVRTDKVSSQIFLQNGPSVMLATNSAATMYNDHLVLSQGSTRVDNMNNYSVQANGYRVEPDQPGTQAVVRLNNGAVEVASMSGAVKVYDAKGAMLNRVGAGTATAFSPHQSGASTGPSTGHVLGYTAVVASLAAAGLAAAALVNSNDNNSPSSR